MSQWRGKESTNESFCFCFCKKQKEKTQNARQSYVLLTGKDIFTTKQVFKENSHIFLEASVNYI